MLKSLFHSPFRFSSIKSFHFFFVSLFAELKWHVSSTIFLTFNYNCGRQPTKKRIFSIAMCLSVDHRLRQRVWTFSDATAWRQMRTIFNCVNCKNCPVWKMMTLFVMINILKLTKNKRAEIKSYFQSMMRSVIFLFIVDFLQHFGMKIDDYFHNYFNEVNRQQLFNV